MLIKRVYEVDPIVCPRYGSEMAAVAFIDPPQGEVIEKILRHCGLWQGSARNVRPGVAGVVHELDGCFSDSQARELTFVDMDMFETSFWRSPTHGGTDTVRQARDQPTICGLKGPSLAPET